MQMNNRGATSWKFPLFPTTIVQSPLIEAKPSAIPQPCYMKPRWFDETVYIFYAFLKTC